MKYTNRSLYLGDAGLVQSVSEGAHNFLYRVSTVKTPEWNVGDIVEVAGDRKCIYAKSTGASALFAAHGCEFSHTGLTAIATFAVSAAIGDTKITSAAATHDALDKDELAGGTVIIFDGVNDYYTTTRYITGNDASGENAKIVLYLDAKLNYAVTSGTSKSEVFRNPYSVITVAGNAALPKAGVPMARVPASASYFWLLKNGLTWIAPQSTVNDNGGVGICWRHDGTVEGTETALGGSVPTNDTSQIAGYRVAGSQAGNGPLVMLTG